MRIPGRLFLAAIAAATTVVAPGVDVRASGQDVAVVRLQTVVRPRLSLHVSDRSLTIPASAPGETEPRVVGVVGFRAAARTSGQGEVVLTVEAFSALDHVGGPSNGSTVLEFSGDGEGTLNGVLESHTPVVAGRWMSSGVREGQLTFTLRGDVGPNGAVVPLRFVLSAP
jgi:hypothetical protein